MTIDRHAFALGMGRLAGCFGRTVDAEISRTYFAALSPLTTEQFDAAVARTIAEETYWPAPAVLLSKVDGASARERAESAFAHVQALRALHPFRVGIGGGIPYTVFVAEFDGPTRAAIRAVGGLARFAEVEHEQWPGFVKRFVSAHVAASAPDASSPALPAPASPRRALTGMSSIDTIVAQAMAAQGVPAEARDA